MVTPDVSAVTLREQGTAFLPRFDADGLITAITLDAARGDVLMVAHMNDEALRLTLTSGIAHYWSRSRRQLWKKGETSGQLQTIVDIAVDCDQDALLLRVTVGGDGGACHTGARSCFYRRLVVDDSGTPHLIRVSDADSQR